MSLSQTIRVDRRGPIAIWTLDRSQRGNSLSRAMLLELGALSRAVSLDRAVRAVVITGEGDRVFCAGADLKERQGMSDADVMAQLDLYRTELGPLDQCPVPVVAAVNGAALGGGVELALVCDLRVAAMHATFSLPETSLGIIPGAGGTQRLPRIIGEARAKEMILLGRKVGAEEGLAWGLVNHIVPATQNIVDATLDWLKPLVEAAPLAQEAALRAIDSGATLSIDEGLQSEKRLYETVLKTDDRNEALAAFAEKRKAVFVGK